MCSLPSWSFCLVTLDAREVQPVPHAASRTSLLVYTFQHWSLWQGPHTGVLYWRQIVLHTTSLKTAMQPDCVAGTRRCCRWGCELVTWEVQLAVPCCLRNNTSVYCRANSFSVSPAQPRSSKAGRLTSEWQWCNAE